MENPDKYDPSTAPLTETPDLAENAKTKTIGSKTFYLLVVVIVLLGALAFIFLNKLGSRQTTSYSPPPATKAAPFTLSIKSPNDETIVTENKVTVSGKTRSNMTVVFFTDADENSVESDSQGNFSGEIMLEEGINTLNITAFGENGEEKNITMNIVYDNQSQESDL